MRRREFIADLLFAATLQRARTQKREKVYRIAYVHPSIPVTERLVRPHTRPFQGAVVSLLRWLGV